ncbi:phage tail protein [Flavivirga eckloniae]|uniref:Phage tail protein n=1 Tax=Flavivirga eckloniae TaxID=1803846 RepID=A0A2K9PQE1_9FLAO|nr:tail fiber protein [Flavivirga eckloniae]AUP79274.1 phage tail protein [Flavivirga eckloniae]
MEGTIGEIRMFAGNFAPRAWAFCEGQLMSIAQNTALFSILGTTYGGDGRTSFALPDLRGRAPVNPGRGPGLSNYNLGQRGGTEAVTLTQNQIPSHTHAAAGTVTANFSPLSPANTGNPTGANFANAATATYNSDPTDTEMAANNVHVTVGDTGGNMSHTNIQPYLSLYYIICLQGVFPSRS